MSRFRRSGRSRASAERLHVHIRRRGRGPVPHRSRRRAGKSDAAVRRLQRRAGLAAGVVHPQPRAVEHRSEATADHCHDARRRRSPRSAVERGHVYTAARRRRRRAPPVRQTDAGRRPDRRTRRQLRSPRACGRGAAELVRVLGQFPGHALLGAEGHRRGEREPAAGGVDVSDAGRFGARSDAAGRRRRHVHDAAGTGRRPRCADRTSDLEVRAVAEGSKSVRDQPVQPRRGHPRQPAVRRHARRCARCPRHRHGSAAVGDAGRRSDARLQPYERAARRQGQGAGRHHRRRVRRAWFSRCVRCGNRTPFVAMVFGAGSGRVRARDVARRQLAARRQPDVAHRFVRSGTESRVLGRRQPRPADRSLGARRARQSVQRFGRRHRSGYRRAQMALSVHAE